MITVVFPGRYTSLAAISEFIRLATDTFGLDSYAAYAVQTAVDEACSNIIEHAYGGENKGEIVIGYEIIGEDLIIRLQDFGKPFEPDNIPTPDVQATLEDRKENGLGLYFMRQWMDEVHFQFSKGMNTLTMVKRKEKKT